MHRFLVRVLVPGAVCVAVSAVGVTGVQASPGISRSQGPAGAPAPAALASPGPGSQLWAERYGTTGFENIASAVKVSPDGGTVFVTGSTDPPSGGVDYATVAYKAATGAQLWLARYSGSPEAAPSPITGAQAAAVSPTTGTVFVTGSSPGPGSMEIDYATVAYHG